MTREVAEKIARGIADKIECNTVDIDDWAEFWGFTREEYEEFLDMAIKALKLLEVGILKDCESCVRLNQLEARAYFDSKVQGSREKPKTGHWIVTGDYDYYVECSCCHKYSPEIWNYCPHCGARMNGVEE